MEHLFYEGTIYTRRYLPSGKIKRLGGRYGLKLRGVNKVGADVLVLVKPGSHQCPECQKKLREMFPSLPEEGILLRLNNAEADVLETLSRCPHDAFDMSYEDDGSWMHEPSNLLLTFYYPIA